MQAPIVPQLAAEARLNVPFERQQGNTCWLCAASMLRGFYGKATFANPYLKGFGENGLDIFAEGRFDAYLRTYEIAIRENKIQSLAELVQCLKQNGPIWAMTKCEAGFHCVVITGAYKKFGFDWVTCNDSGRGDGKDCLMYFDTFKKHGIIGIYSPKSFQGDPDDENYGAWI